MTRPEFRQRYEAAVVATWPRLSQATWRNVADDLERLAGVTMLADVPRELNRFEASLRREGVDAASLAIYLATVEACCEWAVDSGLLADRVAA